MSDLVTWLRAQLDEDERIARAAPPGPWSTSGPDTIAEWMVYDAHWAIAEARAYTEPTTIMPHLPKPEDYIDANATAAHIARHDPARVLAEVEAKRRILDEHNPDGGSCRTCGRQQWEERWDAEAEEETYGPEWHLAAYPCLTLRLLAFPYADRPGYLEEWRP